MIPADDTDPRVRLDVITRNELLDGPLHRQEHIDANSMMLFYIDAAEQGPVMRAPVHSMMMGTSPDLLRLGMAALAWLDQKIGLDRLLTHRALEAASNTTEVRDTETVRDQFPRKD